MFRTTARPVRSLLTASVAPAAAVVAHCSAGPAGSAARADRRHCSDSAPLPVRPGVTADRAVGGRAASAPTVVPVVRSPVTPDPPSEAAAVRAVRGRSAHRPAPAEWVVSRSGSPPRPLTAVPVAVAVMPVSRASAGRAALAATRPFWKALLARRTAAWAARAASPVSSASAVVPEVGAGRDCPRAERASAVPAAMALRGGGSSMAAPVGTAAAASADSCSACTTEPVRPAAPAGGAGQAALSPLAAPVAPGAMPPWKPPTTGRPR